MAGYDIGPFQNIVNVSWGQAPEPPVETAPSYLVASFWFTVEAFDPYFQACNPITSPTGSGPYIGFYNSVRIKPDDYYTYEMDGGLYGFWKSDFTEVPSLSSVSYSGLPAIPPPSALPMFECAQATSGRDVIITTPGTVHPAAPSFDKSLNVTYEFWHINWATDTYCDWIEPYPPTDPSLVGRYDNSGYIKRLIGNVGPGDWFDYRFKLAEFPISFSNFTVTWPNPSTVYTARSLRTYSRTVFGGRVEVLCLPNN